MKTSQFWRRPIVFRSALGVYVLLVFILAAMSFGVTIFDVRGALYLRGFAELEQGRPNGMRGSFQYAPTGEALRPGKMEWQLVEPNTDKRYALELASGEPADRWPDMRLLIPDEVPAGDYELEVALDHEQAPRFLARAPVEVKEWGGAVENLSDLPWPRWRPRDDEAERRPARVKPKRPDLPVALAVTPAEGELSRGFPWRVIFRVYDPETGQPMPATLKIELNHGLLEREFKAEIHTDPLGFAVFEVVPASTLYLDVEVQTLASTVEEERFFGEQENIFEVRLSAVPTQFQLRPHRQVVRRGENVDATIQSVLNNPSYMVDLFDLDGERLLQTQTAAMQGQQGGARFVAPKAGESSPLLRVQTYQSLYGVEHGWDSRYILLVEEDSQPALLALVRELFEWIAENREDPHFRALLEGDYLDEELTEGQLRRLIGIGLEELPRSFELPPVLMNTREADREAMQTWQQEKRQEVALMLGLLLAGGVVIVLYFVALGIARQQREARLFAELDLEHEESAFHDELERSIKLERLIGVLQALVMLATLLAFALGIHMVVSYL